MYNVLIIYLRPDLFITYVGRTLKPADIFAINRKGLFEISMKYN